MAVPAMADWCAVDVLDSAGTPRPLVVAHVDPAKVELARQLRLRYPADPNAPTGVARVGISGWRYPPWRKVFYPDGLPQRAELEFASRQLNSIELNGSFYSLQRPSSYQRWYDETPDGFVFSVKGPRFVSHLKKLADVEAPLANFFASGVLALGAKFGPVLWQLPPTLGYDRDRLAAFF